MIWYFTFFLLSGFCSLVYEVVWLRLAMAKFGVTTPMVSIVLSTFMAGLAIGSWGAGALTRRRESSPGFAPLRLYGLAELMIGASGLVVPSLFNLGYRFLGNWGDALNWDSSLYYLASGGWIALTLLPWCICMGATFPLAMAAIHRSHGESERSFSYLYLSNVLGAILGTLIPAFILIEMLGFHGTLWVASSVNWILAAAAIALSFGPLSAKESAKAVATGVSRKEVSPALTHLPSGSTLWLLFLNGLCSMAMEVVWIRQLTPFLGNVVYAFATILALYLAATCAGSFAYRLWAHSHSAQQSGPAWISLGALALLPLLFADPSPPLVPAFLLTPTARTALAIVPFSAVLGFLTPMLVDYFSAGDPDRAGRAYAVNVIGSILGPLLAGFWILPWKGDRGGLVALSLPLFAVGLFTAFRRGGGQAERRSAFSRRGVYMNWSRAICAAGILLSIPLVTATRDYSQGVPNRVLLRDSTATVVAYGEGRGKQVLVNGNGITGLTSITKYMAHIPLAFLRQPPQSGLVICFGMGTTFRSMLSWGIETTGVDLVPSIPKLFGFFHADGDRLLGSPFARVVADDGRRFLDHSLVQYDVITLDPPPPPAAPTSSLLYSREFYAIASAHLRPGGILHAWLPEGDDATIASMAKAIRDSFPHVRVFNSIEGWGYHFLASIQPLTETDPEVLASRLPAPAIADLTEWDTPNAGPEELFRQILQHELSLEDLVAKDPQVSPIEDDHPINEYYYLRQSRGYQQ
ncbi:MAG: fused MFS/spermidine synthase [Acidobacteria bacterium]|nr:fused MFS/spermidine synthase [Acidobacteriota bacterium]